MNANIDPDGLETAEWIDALRAVLQHRGADRATFLLDQLNAEADRAGARPNSSVTTPYVNTIPVNREVRADWDRDIEHRIRSTIRWNPARQQGVIGARRTHRQLSVRGHALRYRLRALLARAVGASRR